MFLIRVIPLTKLPTNAPAVLDYFWDNLLVRGALVQVPMGRRLISALVVDVQNFRTAKIAVKKSVFALKKIDRVLADTPQLTIAQLTLAHWISIQYACSLATALRTVAPAFIGKRGSTIDHSGAQILERPSPVPGDVLLTQPDTAIETLIAALSESDGQTLILVPDHLLAQSFAKKLSNTGARHMHGAMPASEFRSMYSGILNGTIRTLIGTRSALFLPWSALTHIIVEDPLNEMYKSDMTPRLNAPDVARQLASLHGARLTWLSPALSTVQHHLVSTGAVTLKDRKPYWPAVTVSTVETEHREGHQAIFSRAAENAILDAHDSRTPLLIYSARRGYATVARCTRCNSSVACDTCNIPLRWNRTSEDLLVCYHCAAFSAVPRQCTICHAGILKPSGIPGSQKLVEAVNVLLDRHGFSKSDIPILDSDLIKNAQDIHRTLGQFDSMEHPVLVSTGMIFAHRYDRTFTTIVIPHLDMLNSNPDYRSHDRLIAQLEKLADFMPERMILQSFQDDGITPFIANRNWKEFFKLELIHRKNLRWPPYSRIVKLSFTARNRTSAVKTAHADADKLRRTIRHLNTAGTQILGPEPALIEKSAGLWTQHLIVKSTLSPSRLFEVLQYVPPQWVIDVDPRSIS